MNGAGKQGGGAALTVTVVVAVIAVIAAAWLALGRPSDHTQPTVAASDTPKRVPTTSAPQPSPERDPVVRNAYALTVDGDLVEIQPDNGAVTRAIASDPLWRDSTFVISPDGAYAYIDAFDPTIASGPDMPGEIQRVSLAPSEPEGAAHVETVVPSAAMPAISPDGASLAYFSVAPGTTQSLVRSLTVMDLATGQVTASVPDDQCVECEREVTPPTWTPDSERLIVGLGWFDGFPGTTLWEVDPASTTALAAARQVGPANAGDVQGAWFGRTAFTTDGTLLVPAQTGSSEQWEAARAYAFGEGPKQNLPASSVALVDAATGAVLKQIPVDGIASSVAVEPGGSDMLIAVIHPDTDEVPGIYRWDGSTLTRVADAFTAVAW